MIDHFNHCGMKCKSFLSCIFPFHTLLWYFEWLLGITMFASHFTSYTYHDTFLLFLDCYETVGSSSLLSPTNRFSSFLLHQLSVTGVLCVQQPHCCVAFQWHIRGVIWEACSPANALIQKGYFRFCTHLKFSHITQWPHDLDGSKVVAAQTLRMHTVFLHLDAEMHCFNKNQSRQQRLWSGHCLWALRVTVVTSNYVTAVECFSVWKRYFHTGGEAQVQGSSTEGLKQTVQFIKTKVFL